ncbi:hypothetical protein VTK56DRAFT_5495 [Thermocarpiscus australiensis]
MASEEAFNESLHPQPAEAVLSVSSRQQTGLRRCSHRHTARTTSPARRVDQVSLPLPRIARCPPGPFQIIGKSRSFPSLSLPIHPSLFQVGLGRGNTALASARSSVGTLVQRSRCWTLRPAAQRSGEKYGRKVRTVGREDCFSISVALRGTSGTRQHCMPNAVAAVGRSSLPSFHFKSPEQWIFLCQQVLLASENSLSCTRWGVAGPERQEPRLPQRSLSAELSVSSFLAVSVNWSMRSYPQELVSLISLAF